MIFLKWVLYPLTFLTAIWFLGLSGFSKQYNERDVIELAGSIKKTSCQTYKNTVHLSLIVVSSENSEVSLSAPIDDGYECSKEFLANLGKTDVFAEVVGLDVIFLSIGGEVLVEKKSIDSVNRNKRVNRYIIDLFIVYSLVLLFFYYRKLRRLTNSKRSPEEVKRNPG